MKRLDLTGFAALLIVFAIGAGGARAGVHKDDKLGYRIVVPRGWKQMPVKTSERWMVAKFLSSKKYAVKDASGWTGTFKPDMRVIVLPLVKENAVEPPAHHGTQCKIEPGHSRSLLIGLHQIFPWDVVSDCFANFATSANSLLKSRNKFPIRQSVTSPRRFGFFLMNPPMLNPRS